jgi:hypothetical protein
MVLARLRFNFLKLSPSYAAGCHQVALGAGGPKVNAKGREVLKTLSRYGDVSKVKFDEWALANSKIHVPYKRQIEIHRGDDLKSIQKTDVVLCFPNGANTMTDKELLAYIKVNVPKVTSDTKITPVVEKNLWKNIYLSYLNFSNPEERALATRC